VIQGDTIDVTRLVDDSKVSTFNIKLIAWSFLILVIDGYDTSAVGFAAPALAKAWHITNMAQLGTMFSAGVAGIMVGAVAFGYAGDRFGRKNTLIAGILFFGILSLAVAFSSSIPQLIVLRFLAGIGLGAVYPLTIVLNAEYAPKRFRGTLVTIMFVGAIVGAGIPGPIAAWIIPSYGWQAMFVIGGVVPILLAILMIFVLPESMKYLALKNENRERLAALVKLIRPDLRLGQSVQFIATGEVHSTSLSVRELFSRGLSSSTILIWILFSIGGMTFYFVQAWMPTILTTSGIPMKDAAIAVALYQLGGVVGGTAISRPMDWFGIWTITALYAVAIPAALLVSAPGNSEELVMFLLFISGICLLGGQLGLNTVVGLIYPTYIRGNGVGWAFGVGRLGTVIALSMTGVLLNMHLPLQQLFFIVAAMLAIGVIASVIFARLNNDRVRHSALEPRLDAPAE
jgi:MFS transporter, AAHS family, 4-hydroxybenzoate transporter